jgi:hypothetical protein
VAFTSTHRRRQMSKPATRIHGEEIQPLKRLALQLACQLPEDPGRALLVLSLTETLVRSFWEADEDHEPPKIIPINPGA